MSPGKPHGSLEVLKEHPDYKPVAPPESFKPESFNGMDADAFREIQEEGYRTKVVITDAAKIKDRYRSGDIREILVLEPNECLLGAVAVIAWSPLLGENDEILMAEHSTCIAKRQGLEPTVTAADHVRKMAKYGVFCLVHDQQRCETLPSDWKSYCLPLDALRDDNAFEAIFEPPTCYIQLIERFEEADEREGLGRKLGD